jgi:hypothetical protein
MTSSIMLRTKGVRGLQWHRSSLSRSENEQSRLKKVGFVRFFNEKKGVRVLNSASLDGDFDRNSMQ